MYDKRCGSAEAKGTLSKKGFPERTLQRRGSLCRTVFLRRDDDTLLLSKEWTRPLYKNTSIERCKPNKILHAVWWTLEGALVAKWNRWLLYSEIKSVRFVLTKMKKHFLTWKRWILSEFLVVYISTLGLPQDPLICNWQGTLLLLFFPFYYLWNCNGGVGGRWRRRGQGRAADVCEGMEKPSNATAAITPSTSPRDH